MVDPGHIGLFEVSVTIDITMVNGIKNMLFGVDTVFFAKLIGPGKVHVQTLMLPGLAHAMISYLPSGKGGDSGGFQFKLG